MSLSVQVVWGGRWEPNQRLTPELINRIFEQASFLLQGTLDAAAIGPGSLTSAMIGTTFITGLPTAVPEGVDWVLGHDVSAGAARKFSINAILSLGFGSAAPVTTLGETDEFAVIVGGVAKRITMPLVRTELIDTPNTLGWTTVAIAADRMLIHDASANESKSAVVAEVVRSVTDRVVTTTGTALAFALTSGVSLAALATGIRVIVKFHLAPGVGATLNVDSRGAKQMRTADGAVIAGGQVVAGQIVELIYDAAANAGAGAWLALSVSAVASRTSVIFSGIGSSTSIGLEDCAVDATNDWITTIDPHGLVTGEVIWFRTATGGLPAENFPYYVIVSTANRFRLASTRANSLAGVYLNLPAQSNIDATHWPVDPILSAVNVDSVIYLSPGRFYVDFTVPMPSANFAVALTTEHKDATANYATNACLDASFATRSAEGFGLRVFNNTSDEAAPGYVSAIVFQ